MRALITGASGFIGFSLARKLAEAGNEVICLVRKTSSIGKVNALKKLDAKVYIGDITDENSLKNLPADVDVVFHLAALLGHTISNYEAYREVNVNGTRNLVKRFLGSDVKRFVFTSSIAAIGLPKTETGLVDESVKCSPITPYGKSKFEAEKLLLRYYNEFKFPINILRPPTVYGPGGKDGFFETVRFTKQKIEKRRPIFYVGRGTALTSLCYIDNLVDALILAMKSKIVGEIFHIDDGRPYSNKEILDTISTVFNAKPLEIYVPKAALYALAYVNKFLGNTLEIAVKGFSKEKLEMLSTSMAFDTSKARKYLGYNPSGNLKELVEKTISWYTENNLLSCA